MRQLPLIEFPRYESKSKRAYIIVNAKRATRFFDDLCGCVPSSFLSYICIHTNLIQDFEIMSTW